jgi:hypothetical protein
MAANIRPRTGTYFNKFLGAAMAWFEMECELAGADVLPACEAAMVAKHTVAMTSSIVNKRALGFRIVQP